MKDIKLYPHNQETYDKIQALWKTENKVAAVQATGTGKSYLILKCVYNTPEANKVILAPSNYILEQIEKEAGEQLPNTKLLTYSKLSFMSDMEIKELNIGYIFLDEFHRCGAEQWGDGVQRLLSQFPDAKVLGTSANHIRFLDNARNMGEELFNGNIVNNLSLAEAIVKKILPMPKYISALYTFEDEVNNLKTKVENSKNDDESKKELLKQIEIMKHKLDKSKGIPNILKKHLYKNYNGKFIIFCKDKVHLDEMKETVVEWFKQSKITKQVDVYSVYSNYEYGNVEVEAFIGNKNPKSVKLLFSIEMFNEGIHIEDVTGVILLRPTVSPIIYYQQIGRAMQAGKDNIPVIFDLVNNFNNIGAKNFVEDLEKEVKLKNAKIKDDDHKVSEDKKYVDISNFMIFDEILEAKDLFEKIEDSLIDNWNAMYEKLKMYFKEHGNSDVPRNNKNYFQLGKWVSHQRNFYKKEVISKERIKKLELICFNWNSNVFKYSWNNMYKQLKDFYEKNGYSNTFKNRKLKNWIEKQKSQANRNLLSNEKIKLLKQLDFIWENQVESQSKKNWNNMFNLLLEYRKEYGDKELTNKQTFNEKNLGMWIKIQRAKFKKGELSSEQVDKLNKIFFNWEKDTTNYFDDELEIESYHIKYLAKLNNITYVELSKILGIDQSRVSKWCGNKKEIPSKHIPKIAEMFNIEPHLIQPQKGDGCVE